MSIRLDFPTVADGTGLPGSTNADWVAKTAVDVALTPGTMLNAGVLNWLFDTSIDAGDADGTGNRVNLKLVNGGIRAEAPEGTSFLGFSGTGQGLVFAGEGSTWLSLNAGSSPGFQVNGAMQWGGAAVSESGLLLQNGGDFGQSIQWRNLGDSNGTGFIGSLGVRLYDEANIGYSNMSAASFDTFYGSFLGSASFAGPGAGLSFSNGGIPVSISTDGGMLQLPDVAVNGYLVAGGALHTVLPSGDIGLFNAFPVPQQSLGGVTSVDPLANALKDALVAYGLVTA